VQQELREETIDKLKTEQQEKGFTAPMGTKRIGYIILIVSLIVSTLGLYFFLCGPEENVTSLSATRSMKITLISKGNETICLTPFEKRINRILCT